MEDQLALTSRAGNGADEDRADGTLHDAVHAPARPLRALRRLRGELVALAAELSAAVLVDPKGKK